MCYMSEKDRPARVGVRELRQNLSVYLERVKAGESLEVSERGVPVARLEPRRPESMSILDRLIAEGTVTPGKGSIKDIPPPLVLPPGRSLSEILQEMRDEDDR
jgi:prevent-host-death family protein